MSEKRFIIVKSIENLYAIVDKERADKEQILLLSLHKEQVCTVCDLLNEQQATINKLQEELDLIANTKLFSRRKLEEENEQLKKKLEILEKIIADVETSVGMDITNLIDNDMCR